MCAPMLIKETQFSALCSFHCGPICGLKCGEKPETLETALHTQSDTQQGQIALSCKTLWACLRQHNISENLYTLKQDRLWMHMHNSQCY